MTENEWQVRVRGAADLWRDVADGRTAGRLMREQSDMFAEARYREVGPWQSPSETADRG